MLLKVMNSDKFILYIKDFCIENAICQQSLLLWLDDDGLKYYCKFDDCL